MSIDASKGKEAVSGLVDSMQEYSNEKVTFVNTTDLREALVYIAELESKVEKVDTLHFRPEVTRVELIESSQRTYMNYAAENVVTSLQDKGKTLKIFLNKA